MVIEQTWTLEMVFAKTERITLYAEPLLGRIDSPWLALEKGVMKKLKSAIGQSAYKAHEGAGLTPRGIFITESLGSGGNYVTLKNVSDWSGSKVKIEKEIVLNVEKETVYQVFFGREISKWKISREKNHLAIVLYDVSTGEILKENFVKVNFPNAYAYYNYFKDILVKAANYKQYGKGKPCYFIHRVGKQIFSSFKVAWGEVGTQINATVIGKSASDNGLLIPDYTCVYIPLYNENEAHYVCAVLNSTISRIVTSYIHLHPDPHVLEHIKIPKFDAKNEVHVKLAELSKKAHECAKKGDEKELTKIEDKIDELVAELYGLSSTELQRIKEQI
ncbi:MAG: hypothetical protein QXU46_04210 [Candidatus Bathyarchaeia archaeon]